MVVLSSCVCFVEHTGQQWPQFGSRYDARSVCEAGYPTPVARCTAGLRVRITREQNVHIGRCAILGPLTLGDSDLIAFASTTDPARAVEFYRGTLGLELVDETRFALVFDAHGTMLRITIVERLAAAPYTILGWAVTDIAEMIDSLARRGVEFVRYDGMRQDAAGVWRSPSGAQIAWFRDPDGNVLSLTQL